MNTALLATPTATRYDGRTIALHWLTAVLVMLLWLGGQTVDAFGRAWKPDLRSMHIVFGGMLGVVVLLRMFWRLTGGRRLPAAEGGILHVIARGTHGLLYLLTGSAVVLGLATTWFRGDAVFALFAFPGGDRALGHTLRGWHELAANATLFLALAHAAAALFHHYVLRNAVLRRMLPGA